MKALQLVANCYYPPEVRGGKYLGLGVFLFGSIPSCQDMNILHYNCINMNKVGK